MKKRLDVLLTERGLMPSREQAKRIIMEGIVYVEGQKEDKAGSTFPEDADIEVRGDTCPYVSRGGLKLEKALKVFGVSTENRICLDIGASTGGFTDCMLKGGAVKVYSVDSGHGQLSWSLRSDPRVVCMERTNFRYFKPEDIDDRVDLATADVSFISLSKILPPASQVLKDGADMICLIKPQFEAGRENVGKHGVVRDSRVHEDVIRKVLIYAKENRMSPVGLSFSPIKGPEGNIEYLLHLLNFETEEPCPVDEKTVKETVLKAAEELKI
ncbi:MAG: TlyA family RNA methyltransferase [Lachnospiraceae bacterium]|nr:TlyA family RNA methyltransferase [Lachnospiraceae bacterium]